MRAILNFPQGWLAKISLFPHGAAPYLAHAPTHACKEFTMRSPLIGLLLQHGHVHDVATLRRLALHGRRPLPLCHACQELTGEALMRRRSWLAAAGTARYLFPINSP
jgi:hypothetical protein